MTLGIGVIGTGFVANMHLTALGKLPGVRLAGVADVDAGRARSAVAGVADARWTTSIAELLSWPEIDGCIVCTPNDTHVEVGLAVANAGKHLLIEKPLAITLEGADALVSAFAERQLVLMGAHTHRFYNYGREIKKAIHAGEIGRPVYLRLAILGGWIWPDWRAWVIDPRRSGGHVLHNGVHLLDLAAWWLGAAPESIYVQGRKETSADLEIYDYLSMVVRFQGGGTAVCEMSRANRPRSFTYRDVFVQGTSGALSLPWDAEQGIAFLEGGTSLLPGEGQGGFDREVAAWIAAVRGDCRPAVTGSEARLAVAMAIAGEESLRSRRVVTVQQTPEGEATC
ncbi:MAG: Gfo/Idh/MocA family oxidoreductase [Chloroflexi bacterium]|nr:Gfo/Idh/MocA family oxidoreductase [Chloroflexota bacterium]